MMQAAPEPIILSRMPYHERFNSDGTINLDHGQIDIGMNTLGPLLKDAPATARELASNVARLALGIDCGDWDGRVLVLSLGLDKELQEVSWHKCREVTKMEQPQFQSLANSLCQTISDLKTNCVSLRVPSAVTVFLRKS